MWPPGSADTICPRPPLTQTFDRLTVKLVCESHLRWGTVLPNLGTLGLWVLELFAMYATDRQTDKSNAYCPFPYGRGHNKKYHNNNHLMSLYSGQPGWASTRTLRNINPIYYLHYLQIPHHHSDLETFPSRPPSLPPVSNTRYTAEKTRRTWGKESTLPLYSPNSGFYGVLGENSTNTHTTSLTYKRNTKKLLTNITDCAAQVRRDTAASAP